MANHETLTGVSIHEAFNYVQASDPGAVGAGKYWLDTSGDPYILKRRNGTNDGWITIGSSGGAGSDTTAIHDNVSGEISAITEKVTPVAADLLLIEDSAASNVKKKVQIGNLPTSGGGLYASYAKLQEQQAANTSGGTFTAGSYATRVINTEVSDNDGIVALASNQFTLQAGTYRILAIAPAYMVNRHKAKLRNITDAADEIIGKSAYSAAAADNPQTESIIQGQFTIASQKVFEIQHRCQTTKATSGLGVESNFGDIEVYTTVEIWKYN